MTPRQEWFKKRIDECLESISKLKEINDWIEYKSQAHELARELMYAATEWDRFYRDIGK